MKMKNEKYLYTIGYTEKSLKEFTDLLIQNKITKVFDIRLKNSSQLAGFAKADDLKYILEEFLKVKYEYQRLLCPTEEIFDKYKKDNNWDAYEAAFTETISQRQIETILPSMFNSDERICLLCSENYAAKCHRRLVAECFKKFDNSIKIIHLEKQLKKVKSDERDTTRRKTKQSFITSVENSTIVQH